MSEVVINVENVSFSWPGQSAPTLQMDAFKVERQDQVFIAGPSGSGKSTLLALIGGIVVPQRGTITILGTELHSISASARDQFRVDHIGFIF